MSTQLQRAPGLCCLIRSHTRHRLKTIKMQINQQKMVLECETTALASQAEAVSHMRHHSQRHTHQLPAHSMRFCFRLPHVLLTSGEQLLFKPKRRTSWAEPGSRDRG
jgi:hypothetical protein